MQLERRPRDPRGLRPFLKPVLPVVPVGCQRRLSAPRGLRPGVAPPRAPNRMGHQRGPAALRLCHRSSGHLPKRAAQRDQNRHLLRRRCRRRRRSELMSRAAHIMDNNEAAVTALGPSLVLRSLEDEPTSSRQGKGKWGGGVPLPVKGSNGAPPDAAGAGDNGGSVNTAAAEGAT